MKINGATIENMAIGNTTFTDSYEFIKALKRSRDMLADVYINSYLVATTGVVFSSENNWLIANTSFRFALSKPVLSGSLMVRVYQAGHKDVITMSSMTLVKEYIETGDQDMSLRFTVMSETPYNSRKIPNVKSKIEWLRTSLLQPVSLEDLPTDDTVSVDDGDTDEPLPIPPDDTEPTLDPTHVVFVTVDYYDEAITGLWKHDPESDQYVRFRKSDTLECNAGSTYVIRAGLSDSSRELYVEPVEGIVTECNPIVDEDIDQDYWNGASSLYQIQFTADMDTTIIISSREM